jgi:hypothetical protein
VEEYFTEIPGDRREGIVEQLERMSVTPGEVARLCSIRLGWRPTEPGVYYVNTRVGPVPTMYFVGVPKGYEPGKPRSLVLMLPTVTAFAVKKNMTAADVTEVYSTWMRDELEKRPESIVVMPLLHLTDLWGPGYAGMNNAMKPVMDVCERLSVDVRRVYLRGQGMSGHAVWNLGLLYPTYFAAINPLAGGASYDWQRMRVIGLRNTLPVVWHDAEDKAVPVKASRDMVGLLRQNRIDVEYEETKGLGHEPGPEVEDRLYRKMTARERELYPREVRIRTNRPDLAFNRADWVQVWQPMDGGQDVRTVFRWSGTGMWSYSFPVTVEAKNTGKNRIEITSRNLGALRLLLSSEMVDFSKAMTVTNNGKVVFEGRPNESKRTVLEDQLLLGRGWREYTAAVEVDLLPPPTLPPSTRPK